LRARRGGAPRPPPLASAGRPSFSRPAIAEQSQGAKSREQERPGRGLWHANLDRERIGMGGPCPSSNTIRPKRRQLPGRRLHRRHDLLLVMNLDLVDVVDIQVLWDCLRRSRFVRPADGMIEFGAWR
jgi:hypothetical protein